MIVLIDMDGVAADFERGFLEGFRKKYPCAGFIPLEKRTTFYPRDQYPDTMREMVESIYLASGFYRSLMPIEGAVDGIQNIAKVHELYFCTAPLSAYENCILEKYQWVEYWFGRSWTKRIITTNDKTLVKGDCLVDDNPNVKGILGPSWKQILFNQPYNKHVSGMQRMDWKHISPELFS